MDEENLEEQKDENSEMKVLTIPKDMNFGIEIESDGPSNLKLLRKNEFKDIRWKTITDNGLSEVISPILHGGTKQNTNQIYAVCRKLQELGQTASINGGAHVHIGNEYLHSISAVQNLVDIWCNCEKIMFCISNPPGEVIRPEGLEYAYPISGMLSQNYNKLIKKDPNEYREIEQYEDLLIGIEDKHNPYGTELHCRAINLYTLHHTFEFRLANSTVNPETWIENINLFGGIIKATKEVTDIQNKSKEERTPEEKIKLANLYKINDDRVGDNERLEALLNLVVSEDQRDIYRERYIKNITELEKNPKIKKTMASRISDGKIHFNQTSYRESMELDGLDNVNDVKSRVEKLIREYIIASSSSDKHDKKFIETYFQNIEQFKDSYLSLKNMGLEEELYKGLDLSTLDYNSFSNRTINLLRQKQNELIEKQKQEKANEEKNHQTKENILNKSSTIPQRITDLYNELKQNESRVVDSAKRLGLNFLIYEVDQWGLLDVINAINKNMELISNNAQINESLPDNTKTLSMFNGIESFLVNSTYAKDYSNELKDTFEKGFNDKVQDIIKRSKIDRLDSEKQKIENEKVSLIERFLGKGKLQKAKIDNIELRKKVEASKEKKEKVSLEDSLADLYSYVKTDLGGVFTPEIKEFLKQVNNETYVMNNVNIENLKLQIAKKSKEYTTNGKEYLIPIKGGFRKYKTQAMLLEDENKRLQTSMTEKAVTRQNIPSFMQANKTDGAIQRFKQALSQIKEITSQEQGENMHSKEKYEEQNEEL